MTQLAKKSSRLERNRKKATLKPLQAFIQATGQEVRRNGLDFLHENFLILLYEQGNGVEVVNT